MNNLDGSQQTSPGATPAQDLNNVGAGQGKGGFNGQCYNCGEWGHSQRFCTKPKWVQPQQSLEPGATGNGAQAPDKDAASLEKVMDLGGKTGDESEAVPPPPTPLGVSAQKDLKSCCDQACWFKCKKNNRGRLQLVESNDWFPRELLALSWKEQMTSEEKARAIGISEDGKSMKVKETTIPFALEGDKKEKWVDFVIQRRKELGISPFVTAVGKENSIVPGNNEMMAVSHKSQKENTLGDKNELNGLAPEGMKWQTLRMTVDSGACDHVVNPKELSTVEIKQTVASGSSYVSASGDEIKNLGEATLDATTKDGNKLALAVQLAEVNKNLAAVRKICAAGNRVVFDDDFGGGYVENKTTGVRIPIEKDHGTYAVHLNVLVPKAKAGTISMFEEHTASHASAGFTRHAK